MDKRVGIIITVIMIGAAAALPFIPDGGSLINDYPGIMRFHVIANSDSEEDQALKLKVRDYVLGKVQSGVTRAIADPDTEKSGKSDEAVTREYINDNLSQIEDWARQAIEANGASYEATAETGVKHIPAKQYDDIMFPEGNYEALTITIGEGKGQNWWCVVFPPLCLIDTGDSEYAEEFDITGEDRPILKFKTEELLKGSNFNYVCKSAIYDILHDINSLPHEIAAISESLANSPDLWQESSLGQSLSENLSQPD